MIALLSRLTKPTVTPASYGEHEYVGNVAAVAVFLWEQLVNDLGAG